MNEDIGIYAEARRRAQHYAAQNETLRRKILGIGPAYNGARAETVNPFDAKPRLPIPSNPPFWGLHGAGRLSRKLRRRNGVILNDLDVNPLQIVQAVCAISGTSAGKLLGQSHERHISWPRQIAVYFIARYCGELSLKQIAFIFSKDHSTIIHAIRVVPSRIDAGCRQTRALVEEVEAMLRAIK